MVAENGTSNVERRGILKVMGGKMVRVRLTEKDGCIDQIRFTGDFFLHPEEDIDILEEDMRGLLLEQTVLMNTLTNFFEKRELVGASAEDFARLILDSQWCGA